MTELNKENQEVEEEETEEQSEEEILTEEQLETAREVEHYQAKIEALDEQLNEYRAESITEKKREEMRAMNYTDEQIERYIDHIEGETDADIKESVFKIALEIPPRDNFGDPGLMNAAKDKPKTVDKEDVGRSAIRRILDAGKIRL